MFVKRALFKGNHKHHHLGRNIIYQYKLNQVTANKDFLLQSTLSFRHKIATAGEPQAFWPHPVDHKFTLIQPTVGSKMKNAMLNFRHQQMLASGFESEYKGIKGSF